MKLKWLKYANRIVVDQPTNIPKKTYDIAFVTFANNGHENNSRPLQESIKNIYPKSDFYLFTKYDEINSPSHNDCPYGFKPYAVDYLKNKGYRFIIWCDSCIRLLKDIDTLLPEVSTRGVFLQQDGWNTGQWANDKSLRYFNVSRDEATNISAIYACIMLFDFNNLVAHQFLNEWKTACDNGIFCGKWNNKDKTESDDERCLGHRHDQTCAELISYKMNIPRGFLLLTNGENKYFSSWGH